MALFKINKGSKTDLGKEGNVTRAAHEGYAYFTPDDGKFYIDIMDADIAVIGTNRIPLNAASSDQALSANKLSNNTKIGDTNHPVYFTENGVPAAVTLTDTANNLLSSLPDNWSANPTDNTVLIRKDNNGSNSFGQVTFETVWNYISNKMISENTVYSSYLNIATSENPNTTFYIHTNIQPSTNYVRIQGELTGAGSEYHSNIIKYSLYVKNTDFGSCYYVDFYNKLNTDISAILDDDGYLHIAITPKTSSYSQWYLNCFSENSTVNRISSIDQTAPSTTAYNNVFTKLTKSILYTPEGTNSTSSVSITPTTSDIYQITGLGSTPSLTMPVDESTETLSFTWNAGSNPTRSSVSVWTGYSSATAAAQTFSGTPAIITI